MTFQNVTEAFLETFFQTFTLEEDISRNFFRPKSPSSVTNTPIRVADSVIIQKFRTLVAVPNSLGLLLPDFFSIHMLTLQQQSQARQELIRLMQRINYGEIRHLAIRNGEPILNPSPVVIRSVKFGVENNARARAKAEDFILKSQVIQLFDELDGVSDGEIEIIDVKAGLPFMALIRA